MADRPYTIHPTDSPDQPARVLHGITIYCTVWRPTPEHANAVAQRIADALQHDQDQRDTSAGVSGSGVAGV